MAENEPSPVPASAPPAVPTGEKNPYDLAEEGWIELAAAAAKIQSAANQLKKGPRSVDGYGIEKALLKHKPALIKEHLDTLRDHRSENKV
jgi:hypothetical protein